MTIFSFSGNSMVCDLKSHADLGNQILKDLTDNPINCRPNSVHVTFDDGPSSNITPVILKELKLREVKASFFVTTTNLAPEHPKYKENRAIVLETMNAGHLIANHGHNHDAYCLRMNGKGETLDKGFIQKEREEQLAKSIELLQWSTGGKYKQQTPQLFRFPYGRGAMPSEMELQKMVSNGEIVLKGKTYREQLAEYRHLSAPLQTLAGANLSHLGWNHDSSDSSFAVKMPIDDVVRSYILKNLKGLCSDPQITKVALFHDIKEMNMTAIPVILDIGKCLGLKFISAQEMVKDKNLNKTGVLIDKQDVLIGMTKNIIETLDETKHIEVNQCTTVTEGHKTCYSKDYEKTYQHCTGGDYVCFDGEWKANTDPIVVNNCHGK
jgi:peptidoglycan/xylan/chitin deacetylase (PgdA/CDA1 family)